MIMNVEKGIANVLKGWFFCYLLAYITDSFYLCMRIKLNIEGTIQMIRNKHRY